MAARKPCPAGNFFGKNFPRAVGKLGDENRLVKDDSSPQLPNAPLLHWAAKADWNSGGAAPKRIGKAVKSPISPQDAYILYLQSRVTLPQLGQQGTEERAGEEDVEVLKHEAAVEGHKSWAKLSDKEKNIFEDIAKEDMRRFQEEAVSYELRNPGWFQAWLTKQGGQVGSKAGQKSRRSGRPRPPLTAWMAFVQATLAKLKENHPEAVAGIKQMELMRMAMKEAHPIYQSMSAEELAPYKKAAQEDRERWEKELEAFPDHKAKLAHKESKAARKKRAKAAKKRAQKEPEEHDGEAEEEVDTTGMTALQAWAAKQRAARRKEARKTAAAAAAAPKKRRTRKAAQQAAVAMEEEAAEEEDPPVDDMDAELAALPDEAYIRTRGTDESDGDSDEGAVTGGLTDDAADDDVDVSDDDGADSAQGEPSVIPDTQLEGEPMEPMTQGTEDGGVLSRVRSAISAGIGWLTTTKRRGLLSSMQEAPMAQKDDVEGLPRGGALTPCKLEASYRSARGHQAGRKRRRREN